MLKIAGLQTDIEWENPKRNFALVESTLSGNKPDVLVLPEMFATGFSMNVRQVTTSALEIEAFLADLAVRHKMTVIAGYAKATEDGGAKGRNLAGVWDRAGKVVACYQKIQTFTLGGETQNYESGQNLASFSIEGIRVSLFVCYDLRFPELFRAVAAESDLIVVIANWPDSRKTAWTTLLRARAIENQCYVLGVNRVGKGDGLVYSGDSLLIDPVGEILSSLPENQAGLVTGQIDPEHVRKTRERFPFLKDRRMELYRNLLSR